MGIAAIIGLETRALRAALAEAKTNQIRADVNQEKADIVDSFNGNVKLALQAIDVLDSLRFGWEAIPDAARYGMVERVRGKIADQVTLARSFREMAHDREVALREGEE